MFGAFVRQNFAGGRAVVPTERRLICENCGQEFGCARDSIADCWCNAEPYRMPMPAPGSGVVGGCLCPTCLRQAASRLRPGPGESA
jgi:hypothetical protein